MAEFTGDRGNPGEWDSRRKRLSLRQRRQLSPDASDMSISLPGGDVTISGFHQKRVPEIETELGIRGETEQEARDTLDQMQGDLVIHEKGHMVEIDGSSETGIDERVLFDPEAPYSDVSTQYVEDEEDFEPQITRSVEVRVSPTSRMVYEIHTKTAHIGVEAAEGKFDVTSEFGDMSLYQTEGDMTLYTKTGFVSGEYVSGVLHAKTDSGEIILDHPDGEVHITSLLGDVKIDHGVFRGPDNSVIVGFGNLSVGVENDDVFVELQARPGKIRLPNEFIMTDANTVMDDGEPNELIEGHFGEISGDTPSNVLFLRNKTGRIELRKDEADE